MRTTLMAGLLWLAGVTPALAEDLAHCTAIDNDGARLACYDALAGRGNAAAAVVAPVATPPPAAARASAPVVPPAAIVAAPKAPASAIPPLSAEARFGAENLKGDAAAQVKQESTDAIQSTIVGEFSGWDQNTRFTLANGQVWKVDEEGIRSYRERENVAVTVKKGMFGAYFMNFDELRARVKVERIR